MPVKPRRPRVAHDGRVRRGVQSRQKIVDALVDLVGSGVVQPTAQQVADRAGVGIRTVFRHFSEMERLYQSMDARLESEVRPLLSGAIAAGTREQRIAAMARQRAAFFERIAPYKRSANLLRWRSPFLQQRHRFVVDSLRSELMRWLPELETASPEVLEGIDLISSFEAWERLRNDQRLGPKQAIAVIEHAVSRFLTSRSKTSR